jgi:pimeloyl-ACP methyl ester carboxylesterase
LANTFPPGELSARHYGRLGKILPVLPEWLVMRAMRRQYKSSIYPAAGNSELVLAYLKEQTFGKMGKSHLLSRARCALAPFAPPDMKGLGVPVLILEADNDPLVPEGLREGLKATYPAAQVRTLQGVGHFSYLNEPEAYTAIVEGFVSGGGG